MRTKLSLKSLVCIGMFLISQSAFTQSLSSTLKQLLQLAETNYPLLKAKMFSVKAAEKNIELAKKTSIPSLDAGYQLNYATYNNITGMANMQMLEPISGPPTADNQYHGVFGSAAGLLLNWQPITLGQRNAQIDYAKENAAVANADAQNEVFQHKIKVITAYLDVVSATELIKVYEENVKRNETNLKTVKLLVSSGIRPGVDSALFKAELSKAKVDLLNIKKYKDRLFINLSQLVATENIRFIPDSQYCKKLPQIDWLQYDSIQNPSINIFKSTIALSESYKKILSKTTMPTLGTWATTYARGSGIAYNGDVNTLNGLGLQRVNYGIGLQLSFPILQSAKIKPQLQQQEFIIQSNKEKLNDLQLQLRKQNELADTTLRKALEITNESPLFLESAQFSYRSMQSRYESGLANISDLLQTQYALMKAETDYKLSFMEVWKAFLFKAAVNGDLNKFLNQVN